MEIFKIVLPQRPIPQQRPRITYKYEKFYAYIPARIKEYIEGLKIIINNEFKKSEYYKKIGKKIDVPVEVNIKYFFHYPKRYGKYKKDVPHISRPDLDNLDKAIFDALIVILNDDSQIYKRVSEKYYSTRDEIEIVVKCDEG